MGVVAVTICELAGYAPGPAALVFAPVMIAVAVVAPSLTYTDISNNCNLFNSRPWCSIAIFWVGLLANAFLTLCYAFAVAILATLTY